MNKRKNPHVRARAQSRRVHKRLRARVYGALSRALTSRSRSRSACSRARASGTRSCGEAPHASSAAAPRPTLRMVFSVPARRPPEGRVCVRVCVCA